MNLLTDFWRVLEMFTMLKLSSGFMLRIQKAHRIFKMHLFSRMQLSSRVFIESSWGGYNGTTVYIPFFQRCRLWDMSESDSVWTWSELQSRDKVVWWTEDWVRIKKTMSLLQAPQDDWQPEQLSPQIHMEEIYCGTPLLSAWTDKYWSHLSHSTGWPVGV